MTIRSFPFNSRDGDRKYKAEDFAIHESNLYTNGLLGNESNNMQVFANNDMTVYVNNGISLINGVTTLNDEEYMLDIGVADSSLSRIDKVVVRLDKVERTAMPVIKKGRPASDPKPPALQQDVDGWEIGLADIRVDKGAIKITQANIRDLRHTKECGVATFRGMPINLDSLYIQYEEELKQKVYDSGEIIDGQVASIIDKSDQAKETIDTEIYGLLEKLNKLIEEDGALAGELLNKMDKVDVNGIKGSLAWENGRLYLVRGM